MSDSHVASTTAAEALAFHMCHAMAKSFLNEFMIPPLNFAWIISTAKAIAKSARPVLEKNFNEDQTESWITGPPTSLTPRAF